MKNLKIVSALLLGLIVSSPALAHFQLVYTPEVNIERPTNLPFRLVFTHPFENGHTMEMGTPEEFVYYYKGKKVDLKSSLKPITWTGSSNQASAYAADVKIKRNGDYIFTLTPSPYYEKSEDIYIQQITKSFVNKGGIPTEWNEAVGLPTEIVPLNKPTNVLAGSTFSGVVLSNGKPVVGAEIEIEYMAAVPDLKNNKPNKPTVEPMPGGAVVAITDARGVFTFGVPRAGFWGFAALGVGPVDSHNGKELSQDAVLWVRAYDMK
ncbi:MAG: DUF4198 domain-containing protein [Rhodospirillales bacterium]|nr:DUF4198 domain-containing protein [Rhodospirillales bacterium]